MTRIGLFYGSKRGDTQSAAKKIKEAFDAVQKDLVTLHDVKNSTDLSMMAEYDKLILGSSTWENGGLQEHWLAAFPQMDSVDLQGKQVAVFGLGDQYEFSSTFQGAIGVLAHKARERGAQLVGLWPTKGYEFDASPAVEDGHFLGLALDNMNQFEMSSKRIKAWVKQLTSEFGLG